MKSFLISGILFLLFSLRKAKPALLAPKPEQSTGSAPYSVNSQAQVLPRITVNTRSIAANPDTKLMTAAKAAQLATSATTASAAVYTAATAGVAGWGASLGLLGVPLAVKSIFDMLGGSAPEFGTSLKEFAQHMVAQYRGRLGDGFNTGDFSPHNSLIKGLPSGITGLTARQQKIVDDSLQQVAQNALPSMNGVLPVVSAPADAHLNLIQNIQYSIAWDKAYLQYNLNFWLRVVNAVNTNFANDATDTPFIKQVEGIWSGYVSGNSGY